MSFENATTEYYSSLRAACSQFRINTDGPVELTMSSSSRYKLITLDAEQTLRVNTLAKEVGMQYENGPERSIFMVYRAICAPGGNDDQCRATDEEKRAFARLFETANASIAKLMGWSLNPNDVSNITVNKTVDFSFNEPKQAYTLSIRLSEEAAKRLAFDQDERCSEYILKPLESWTYGFEKTSGSNDHKALHIFNMQCFMIV